MKRLMSTMLILGVLSTAKAALVFTVNGEPQPDEITLQTSETIELGLELAGGHTCSTFSLGYRLTNARAELLVDIIMSPYPDCPIIVSYPDPQWVNISWPPGCGPLQGPAVLMNGLILHCVAEGPVTLEISSLGGGTIIDDQTLPDGVLHTLTIHQVPEPTAILLLATGALLLRRRR